MKKSLFFAVALCTITVIRSHAQVAINTDSSTADPSAILDLKSSNKGLLLPRMKDISANPIANPKAGLLVYDSATKANWIYDGNSWVKQGTLKLPYLDSVQANIASALAIKNTATNSSAPAISGISLSGPTYNPVLGATFPNGDYLAGSTAIQGELNSKIGGRYSAAIRGINQDTTSGSYYDIAANKFYYAPGTGVLGYHAGGGAGVYGYAKSGNGIFGISTSGNGLYGQSTSGNALSTNGKVKLSGIGEGDGKVLTSDALGNATWQNPSGSKIGFSSALGNGIFANSKSTVHLINYSTPDFNDGSGFDQTNGKFTAPVSGVYHFDVKIDFASNNDNIDISEYSLYLDKNGETITFTSASIAFTYNTLASLVLTYNAKLQAGDEMSVDFYNGSEKQILIYSYGGTHKLGTSFSGYKVY